MGSEGKILAILATVVATIHISLQHPSKHYHSNKQIKYDQTRIHHPITKETSSRHSLSNGNNTQYLLALGVTKNLFLNQLLPWLDEMRCKIHCGSPLPYKHSKRGRKLLISSVDLLVIALSYMKTKDIVQ